MARYRIVPERSRVSIDARSSLHPIHSTSDGLEGYVELEFAADGALELGHEQAGRLSFPVNRLSSGNGLEDRELQRRIDARRFPTIQGVLQEVERTGTDGCYQVTGEVTFRGVARTHRDQMTVHPIDGVTVQLEGSSRFDVRDFGMEPPRMFLLKVEPEVQVRVDIVAVKEG